MGQGERVNRPKGCDEEGLQISLSPVDEARDVVCMCMAVYWFDGNGSGH